MIDDLARAVDNGFLTALALGLVAAITIVVLIVAWAMRYEPDLEFVTRLITNTIFGSFGVFVSVIVAAWLLGAFD